MGNKAIEKRDEKQTQYVWRQNRKHPSLGMLIIAKQKEQEHLSNIYNTLKVIQIVDKTQKQIRIYASKLDRRIQLSRKQSSNNIIKVISYKTWEETFKSDLITCGTDKLTRRVQIKIEDLDKTLFDVFNEHKANFKKLQLRQICQIMKFVVDDLVFMYDHHISGVIPSFETIIKTAIGQYKLVDSQILNQADQHQLYKSIYNRKKQNINKSQEANQKSRLYLAPQLLETLNAKEPLEEDIFDYISYHRTPKSDIFSLAAIFLEFFTQIQFRSCYLWQLLMIQEKIVTQMIAVFRQKIKFLPNKQQKVISIMQKMLKFEEIQRIGLSQLQTQLQGLMKSLQIPDPVQFQLPKINNRFHTDFEFRHIQSQRYQRPCLTPITPHQQTNNIVRKPYLIKHMHQSSQAYRNLKLKNASIYNSPEKCYEVTSINSSRTKYPRLKAHIFSNGAKYEGQINQQNQFEGKGILYYPDMTICYKGKWKNNKFHGLGTLFSTNHNETLSQYQQIKKINHLNFTEKNMQKYWQSYQGQFKQDKKTGVGIIQLCNGDHFQGTFDNNLAHGSGTYFYSNGQKIEGIWQKDSLLVLAKSSPFKKKIQPFCQ